MQNVHLPGLVTLLTDFGWQDVYVAVMKGAIAQVDPTLRTIDLTHDIPPQDVWAARFNLINAFPYFPPGTVHVAVVDPGVGSQRRAVALQLAQGFLVGPDNGLLSGVLSQHPLIAAVELSRPAYWRTAAPSSTFHGRDIFAPVGAHLARGVPLSALGDAIDPASLVQLAGAEVGSVVQSVDRFGNLITNIPASEVEGKAWAVAIAGQTIPACRTYADQPQGALMALVGSHGWVEVAVNCGSAQAALQLGVGSPVEVVRRESQR